MKIIKRDGSFEGFSAGKIEKVVKAAGLPKEKARALARKIGFELKIMGKKEIHSSELRDMIASELKKADRYAYDLYIWYEGTKDKKTS